MFKRYQYGTSKTNGRIYKISPRGLNVRQFSIFFLNDIESELTILYRSTVIVTVLERFW